MLRQSSTFSRAVEPVTDGRIVTETEAAQGESRIIRNAEAELEVG